MGNSKHTPGPIQPKLYDYSVSPGTQASNKVIFGERSRYAVYAVRTRDGGIQWFVADAERPDDLGFPSIVRQEDSFAYAVAGIP